MATGVKTGGRSKGTPNKATVAKRKEVEATGLTPLDYLISVYRDVGADEAKRIDAAKAAAPYLHAKLQPVDGKGDTAQTHLHEIRRTIVRP
jgi:hypothetical protein